MPLLVVAVLVGAGVIVAALTRSDRVHPGAALGAAVARLSVASEPARDLEPYAGLGAWVDGLDYGVAYQPRGVAPAVQPAVIDDLAAHHVKTLFLQAARADSRSPGGLVDPGTTANLLLRAHQAGIRVVAWYLPRFRSVDEDLTNLVQLASFDALGHRFDGVAVDIEYTDDVPDVDERNARLIDLSQRLHAAEPDTPLGAIVLPPVQTEVVNQQLWPDFPWSQLTHLYDVWLPMSYWTFRDGMYADGYSYNEESTRRLRADVGDAHAVVHAIGGIGDKATADELNAFARSVAATGAVGGSIYDWSSMSRASRDEVTALFSGNGPAAALPAVPSR